MCTYFFSFFGERNYISSLIITAFIIILIWQLLYSDGSIVEWRVGAIVTSFRNELISFSLLFIMIRLINMQIHRWLIGQVRKELFHLIVESIKFETIHVLSRKPTIFFGNLQLLENADHLFPTVMRKKAGFRSKKYRSTLEGDSNFAHASRCMEEKSFRIRSNLGKQL